MLLILSTNTRQEADLCRTAGTQHDFVFLRKKSRDKWRARVAGEDKIKIVFILGQSGEESEAVLEESEAHGDILLPTVRDGHHRLSYKVLSGLVWSHLQCASVDFVGKTDDNVVLDLSTLFANLDTLNTEPRVEKYIQH